MRDSAIEGGFDRLLRPILLKLEFEEVRLKNCMRPEFLFRRDRVWFSLSWDWRDQYLEVCLGRLVWFEDVMPRVVVLGDYSYWDRSVTWDAIGPGSDFGSVLTRIQVSLPVALARVEEEYPRIVEDLRNKWAPRDTVDYLLGKEVALDALENYMA
ncbi:hypothetical protein GALL_276170 [mine drainage metagenome]|uniref:Uncharacterized protein n=1 Tax=mine drainage metagenome TaxID=410659 RepID=A0A1J5R3D6_9ZZZZ